VLNATIRGTYSKNNHYLQFGSSIEQNKLEDELNEFELLDSAGYSLPNTSGPFAISKSIKANSDLDYTRISGFIQDNLVFNNKPGLTVQGGLRYNYNTLNNELVISPRIGVSYTPQHWKKDIILRASAGAYHQPPFYREMRRYDGTVNTDLLAQRSWQFSTGLDYAFKISNRPYRFTTEAYYKSMTEVVPYDVDNVRLRYYGENMAKAYAYGIEGRLYGELVKDAESWLSIGFMKTMENLNSDFYYNYYNNAGEIITSETEDQVVADSARVDVGWLRRPTDRRFNLGLYFSDYLSTNENFRVYVQTLFGTNLPYNIPGSVKYRNALEIPAYLRVDIGFTYRLVGGDKNQRRSHDPFRAFNDMWISLEVFNLLDRDNIISYSLVKDFANNTYAIPNRLTPRLINLKLSVSW
jgi:hypothetical protein